MSLHYDKEIIHELKESTGFPDTFIRLNTLAEALGMSTIGIRAAVGRGELPKPFKLFSRAIGFKRSEIEEFINSRQHAVGW